MVIEIDVPGAPASNPEILLAEAVSAIQFFEPDLPAGSSRVASYKWVSGMAPSATSVDEAEVFVAPSTGFSKLLPEYGTKLTALHKFNFDKETSVGIDAYQYYTELIQEAHKVIDGSSVNPIDYPGVRAAGSSVEVLAPLIRSVKVGLEIMPKEGVSISSIKAPVKSIIASYVNSLGVGREVVLSEIVKRVQQVPGVKSVGIASTYPVANSGVITTGSFEVARILDSADISI
jgi:hypothetical protein